MFGSSRRHRPPSQPLNAQTANPNAATAAASAFMKRRESTSSLSSAAAAAALKALPMSPTRVADVQTKRTIRRSASVSSRTSSDGNRHVGLQRKPSSGSMTERTFRSRSPSPRRPDVAPSHAGAPPVPSLPATMPSNPQQFKSYDRSATHRKHSSLNMAGFRVASEKIGKEGEPSWFGPPTGDLSNIRTSDRAMSQPYPSTAADARPDSRGSSVNFSYPARAKPASPSPPVSPIGPPSPEKPRQKSTQCRPMSDLVISQNLVYDPNSRRMIPRDELVAVEQTLQEVSQRPVRKKKHYPSKAGSHLSRGSVSRPREVVGDSEPHARHSAGTSPPGPFHADDDMYEPAVKARIASPAKAHRIHEPSPSHTVSHSQGASGSKSVNVPQSSQVLGKKPSVVKEEPELEEEALLKEKSRRLSPQDSRSKLAQGHVDQAGTEPWDIPFSAPAHTDQGAIVIPRPDEPLVQPGPVQFASPTRSIDTANVGPSVQKHEGLRIERVQSNSPVRAPRFASAPENLTVKHSPPARSVSPRKSALKHHSPSRDLSPSDTSESSSAAWPSLETQARDKAPAPRKKSVRVSFDDQNTEIVGKAALRNEDEPDRSIPTTTKRPWYSHIGRGKKKDILPLDEDEIIMKPRPALPSFGSIRGERKPREEEQRVEERPLVRPYDTVSSPASSETPPPDSSALTTSDDASGLALSSDHAIGAVLSQEQASRNVANISEYHEPLPPIVTSIEGYMSDSDSNTTSSESEGSVTLAGSQLHSDVGSDRQVEQRELKTANNRSDAIFDLPANGSVSAPAEQETPQSEDREIDIPAISVTQPSPKLAELSPQEQHGRRSPAPPGGFPEDVSDISEDDSTPTGPPAPSGPLSGATDGRPATVSEEQEPPSTTSDSAQKIMPATVSNANESESESSVSIYSDAYEDLSDMEGGFMSLDAVVESPISAPSKTSSQVQPVPGSNLSTPTKGPPPSVSTDTTVQASPSDTVAQASPVSLPPVPIKTEDEWEHAKAYWRSLSMAKRKQLEKEAMEEAGVEADLDVEQPVAKVPTRKKSIERRKRESLVRTEMERKAKAKVNDRVYQIQPGSRATHQPIHSPTMRTSMREQPPAVAREPKLRKSLRSNGSSVPSPAPGADLSAHSSQRRKPQLVISKPSVSQPPSRVHGRAISYDAAAIAPATTTAPPPVSLKTSLRRRDSSESVSSFKRSRNSPAETHGFRPSMRNSLPQAPKSKGRFSLRSLSPTGSSFRRNSVDSSATIAGSVPGTGSHFRSTMRGTPPVESTTRKGSLHMPSFGRRTSESKHKHGFLGRSFKGGGRFGDSSDEDTGISSTFHSRFADSSDEDAPAPARTVPKSIGMMAKTMRGATKASRNSSFRGKQPSTPTFAPKKATQQAQPDAVREEESSPSLPDSSDENMPAQVVSAPTTPSKTLVKDKTLQRSGSGREVLGATVDNTSPVGGGTSRPGNSRRRSSIMAVLRRKKAYPNAGGIRRAETSESWARMDTRLERSKSELAAIRGSGSGPEWPLNAEREEEAAGSSVDGDDGDGKRLEAGLEGVQAEGVRPAGPRRVSTTPVLMSVTGVGSDVGSVVTGGTKKKKKFGALRRMFRLDD